MKRGFTLIELLVVVLIIGILSSVALPQYTVAVEKARASEAMINLRYMRNIAQFEYMENGGYANSGSDIMELSGGKWSEQGDKYCTKNFLYTYDDHTFVRAERCTPNSTCTACQSGTKNYEIYMETPQSGGKWQNFDQCSGYTSMGLKVCKAIAGTALTVNDYREE